MLNVIRRESERALSRLAVAHMGVVTGYDPARYAAKVRLEPSGTETGWLPIATTWSGDGWGDYCPPTPGDVVDVHFQEGGKEAGYVSLRFYSSVTKPLAVPSGECWRVHKSGSFLKFRNDGTVEITAGAIHSVAPVWTHQGDFLVTGEIRDINAGYGSLNDLRLAYNAHHHSGVTGGPNFTGVTDIPVA